MYKQIDITDLLAAIKRQVEDGTGIPCYDAVPKDAPAPFYMMELVMSRPANSKTFYRQAYTVNIHSVAAASDSSVPVLNLVKLLEEALTEDIEIPAEYVLENQMNNGVQSIGTDLSGEKRATSTFVFTVRYGFRCKI